MEVGTMTGSYASSRKRTASAAAVSEDTSDPDANAPETWGDRLAAAIPLFAVGTACLVIAIDLYFSSTATFLGQKGSVHLEPWTLFLALAVTGLAAGTFTMLLEEEPTAPVEPTRAAPAAVPPSAPIAPEWDESTLEAERPMFPRRVWELDSGLPEERPSAAPSDTAILDQIDAIAESLRKKTPPRSSE